MTATTAGPTRITLDTNVVLDWLVFRDARAAPLAEAIEHRRLQWVACASMRDELGRTLRYDNLARWSPNCEQVLTTFDRFAIMLPAPPTQPTLRCSDADDQVFLDLAIASGSRWLLTHDRALLRLARRASAYDVAVLRPSDWTGVAI